MYCKKPRLAQSESNRFEKFASNRPTADSAISQKYFAQRFLHACLTQTLQKYRCSSVIYEAKAVAVIISSEWKGHVAWINWSSDLILLRIKSDITTKSILANWWCHFSLRATAKKGSQCKGQEEVSRSRYER